MLARPSWYGIHSASCLDFGVFVALSGNKNPGCSDSQFGITMPTRTIAKRLYGLLHLIRIEIDVD